MSSSVDQIIEQARLKANAIAPTPPGAAVKTPEQVAAENNVQHYPGYMYNPVTNAYDEYKAPPAAPVAPVAYQTPAAPTPPAAPVVYTGNSNLPAVPEGARPGRKLSLEELNAGRTKLSVDTFLKVNSAGIKAGFMRDDPRAAVLGAKYATNAQILIDFNTDMRMCFALRYEPTPGGEAVYLRTSDRIKADDGKDWSTEIAKAMNLDKKCKGDYPSFDVAGTLTKPMVGMDGTEILKAGEKVGFSTSITNFENFNRFLSSLIKDGTVEVEERNGDTDYIGEAVVDVGFKPMVNKNNQHYGLFTFALATDNAAPTPPAPKADAPAAPTPPASSAPAAPTPPAPKADEPEAPKRRAKKVTTDAPAAPVAPTANTVSEAQYEEVKAPPAPPAPPTKPTPPAPVKKTPEQIAAEHGVDHYDGYVYNPVTNAYDPI